MNDCSHAEGFSKWAKATISTTAGDEKVNFTFTDTSGGLTTLGTSTSITFRSLYVIQGEDIYRCYGGSGTSGQVTLRPAPTKSLSNVSAYFIDGGAIGSYSHSEGESTLAIGIGSHAEGNHALASGDYSHAECNAEASGDDSHAEGASTASGICSHAEGEWTEAGNESSHAEGLGSLARGVASHTEGLGTINTHSNDPEFTDLEDIAEFLSDEFLYHVLRDDEDYIASAAHAEGAGSIACHFATHAEGYRTKASSLASHAEGYYTIAKGDYSHAEGVMSESIGESSHAEGALTIAQGNYSHAEGYSTIASSDYSHVEGLFNIIDTEKKYLHIAGNGTSSPDTGDIRSNAHTLDWNGNAWYAGGITAVGNLNVSNGAVYTSGNVLYGAAWNDYAEYRAQKEKIEPGYCVASANNGEVYKTTEKFQACDGIVSDNFGFAIGETDNCQTPLAVAGRVLAYCEGNRYDYNAGDTVCAGPNGKVVRMTREEIREWPDRIIGIVSEIPEYETWGSGNVPVNGRIWIKVK